MKYWSNRKIAKGVNLPGRVARIAEAVEAELASFGPEHPRLLRIGRHESDEDVHRWEVDVELAPGVVLPMEYGSVETMDEDWDDTAQDEPRVVEDTLEGVEACMAMLDRLTDILHETRLSVRRAVARWADQGVHSRLVDVRLAPYDHWRGADAPELRIAVDGLDDCLRPAVVVDETWPERNLAAVLDELHGQLAHRTKRRHELTRQGATRTVSQLALNALAEHGDVAEGLRRFRTEWRFWLPDDTAIMAWNGDVGAGSGTGDAAVDFDRSGVTVAGHLVPDRDLDSLVGRPVTRLLDHPYLSDDMIVLGTSWLENDVGRRSLHVKLDIPQRLFCSASGRTWDPEPATPAGDNVVPFARSA